MELNIGLNKKNDIERIMLVLNLGFLVALQRKAINLECAEGYLFNPYSVQSLEDLGINEKVTELIALGCELEDITSLIPEKLDKNIQNLIEKSLDALNELPVSCYPIPKILK